MEEEDDIDHNITFPSPGMDREDDDILDDYVVEGESKEPVVILIGYITLRYIPPAKLSYFKPHLIKNRATKLLDLLFDYNLEENPVFFHIFSNNGSFLYTEISKILSSQEPDESRKYAKLHIQGVVIDSAPGKRRILNGARAFATSTVQKGIVRYIIYFGMVLYLLLLRIYLFFLHLFKGKQREANPHFIYENMIEDASRWPQLVIYSSADKVILAEDIEEFVKYRKDVLGVSVTSLRYENSDHVAHYRANRESYTIQCLDFLEKCLGTNVTVDEKD